MNIKNNKTINTILMCSLLIMILGYSSIVKSIAVSKDIKINSDWKIEVTNVEETNRHGEVASRKKEWTKTKASFETVLNNSGDKISYTITIKNKGTIDAEISKIKINKEDNPLITYEISNIKKNEVIKAGETKNIYISIEYTNMMDITSSSILCTFDVEFGFEQATYEEPLKLALDSSNFKFEKANITGYENVLTEVMTVKNDINLYGNWTKYSDTGVLKITLPKQYNDVLDNATLTEKIKGPGINSTKTYIIKDLLYTNEFDEYQYLYLVVKYDSTKTKEILTFNINGNQYQYTVNILGPKGN